MNNREVLMMVSREEDLPASKIPKGLRRLKQVAECEFGCGHRVIYNRENYAAQRAQGKIPVLICMRCYGNGEHVRAGYRKV